MTSTKSKIPINLVQRILLERDLVDSRDVFYTLPDGSEATFTIRTLSPDEKLGIRQAYDKFFPSPPVTQNSLGGAQFDLEDAGFQEALQEWNQKLSKGVLAATLGIEEADVVTIEQKFPREFVNRLFATIELLNGIQSDPLIDLVREAIWAPEVLSWLETSKPKNDDIKIADTPLFREMQAMTAAGLNLDEWEKLSPRHKIMYLNFHTYTAAREAYIHEKTEQKSKESPTMTRRA